MDSPHPTPASRKRLFNEANMEILSTEIINEIIQAQGCENSDERKYVSLKKRRIN